MRLSNKHARVALTGYAWSPMVERCVRRTIDKISRRLELVFGTEALFDLLQ